MNYESIKNEKRPLGEIIKELHKYYHLSTRQSVFTLPEIFGKQDRETFINVWLAYLLNPQLNGFGTAPLNALLGLLGEYSVDDNEQVLVETEHTFADNGRRIDILLTTPAYSIGIENKLYSGEQEDQTNDYWKSMEPIRKENKEPLCVYLKPDTNNSNPQSHNFKTITYTKLYEAFCSIPYDHCRDSRKNFFFYEFILYVKEKLMTNSKSGFPKMDDDVKLYQENRDIIETVKEKHTKFTKDLGSWLSNRIEELASQLTADLPKSNYWQIWENKKWLELNFHYELFWSKTNKVISELTEEDEVWLCVHLEGASQDVKKHFNQKRGNILHEERIRVDFSNKDKADESINIIIKKLRSEHYRELAEKADDCIEKSIHTSGPELGKK